MGDRLQYLALLSVFGERTGHFSLPGASSSLSLLAITLVLPSVLLSPWVASRLDRWRRRDLMIAADLVRALLTAAMALLLPQLGWTVLLGFVLANAAANVFFLPARLAIVPSLVPPNELNPANSLGLLASVLATIFGTLVGGPVLALWGAQVALGLDAASFFLSVITLLKLPAEPFPGRREEVQGSWLPGREAFAAVFRSERTSAAVLLLVGTWLGGALLQICAPLRLQQLAPRVTDGISLTLGFMGVGGVLGAGFFASRMGRFRWAFAGSGLAVAALGFAALGAAPTLPWAVGAAALAGFAAAPVYILSDTELQQSVPGSMRAGAMAARDFLCKGAFLLMVLLLGGRVSLHNAAAVLWMGGAGMALLSGYYLLRRPLP